MTHKTTAEIINVYCNIAVVGFLLFVTAISLYFLWFQLATPFVSHSFEDDYNHKATILLNIIVVTAFVIVSIRFLSELKESITDYYDAQKRAKDTWG